MNACCTLLAHSVLERAWLAWHALWCAPILVCTRCGVFPPAVTSEGGVYKRMLLLSNGAVHTTQRCILYGASILICDRVRADVCR
jgi:hypothetical protein